MTWRPYLFGIGLLILVIALFEIVSLLRLRQELTSYAHYWKTQPTNGQFTYIALGDSSAQGIGASKPANGYVGLLAARIAQQTGKQVHIVNLSISGATIEGVINTQLPQLINYKPDLVTIDIGSNDVARNYNSTLFASQYQQLVTKLPKNTVLGNLPYFGGRIRKNTDALDANQHILSIARKYHFTVADVQSLTKQRDSWRMYAADYFHPSNRGYQNWADAFWKVIKSSL